MNPTNLSLTPEQYAEVENELHDRLTNSCAERITRRFFVADDSLIDAVLHNLQNIDCVHTFGEDIVVNTTWKWIEFTSQIPLLSFDCSFGLDPSDPDPKVHFMSMYLSLCWGIQTLHIYRVPHVTLSEENIFFDLAYSVHLLPLSNKSFQKRSSYEQSCTLRDDLMSATSIFFRLSNQLFDTDNPPERTIPQKYFKQSDESENWTDFEKYMFDILAGTIDPVLSPPETQPFFFRAIHLLNIFSIDSFFFKEIFVKQIGNTSPETEKIVSKDKKPNLETNDFDESDAEPSWSWEGISFEVESLQTLLPDSDTSTFLSDTSSSHSTIHSDRISTALTQSSDVTLDLDIKPESDAPDDRSRLLHLKLSLFAPRPDRLPQKKCYPFIRPTNYVLSGISYLTSNRTQILTNELPDDAFFQADEDVLTALSNAVFTIEQTKSCKFIPLSETLFTHLAQLLDSHHPQIRSTSLRLVSHLFSSPSHKALLLKHTLGAIDTSATEMSSEVALFVNTAVTDQLFVNNPKSESSLSVDHVNGLFTPLMSFDKSQHIIPTMNQDVSSLLQLGKDATRQTIPVTALMPVQPRNFKLNLVNQPPLRKFHVYCAAIYSAAFNVTPLPQVLVDYYLEEAWKFSEFHSVTAVCLALVKPHHPLPSRFPIDVMIERLVRQQMQGHPSSLDQILTLFRHSTQLFPSTRLHPFLMRGLHFVIPPVVFGIDATSLIDYVKDEMTADERFVYECLPPHKAITEWIRDRSSLWSYRPSGPIVPLFTFDEWRELLHFMSRRTFNEQLKDFDPESPINREMETFLLTTFALPATFYNPLCQHIAPAIWKACRLDDTPLDIVIDCIDNNSEHPLLILAMCRSFLSKDDLFALLGSEFIVPLLRRSFGSFSPVVNTAALMFVRRVVDVGSVELNLALVSLSVFSMVVRAVEGSSYLEDYMNGTYILSELLETVSGH